MKCYNDKKKKKPKEGKASGRDEDNVSKGKYRSYTIIIIILSIILPLFLQIVLPLPSMEWVSLSFKENDWFSFWAGWIPGFISLILAVWAIYWTRQISDKQDKSNEQTQKFQNQLTLALNLPNITFSKINFFYKEEIKEITNRFLVQEKWGSHTFRFGIFLGKNSFPANYLLKLEAVSFLFEKGVYPVSIPKSNWEYRIIHGKKDKIVIDLNANPGSFLYDYLVKAYYYPTNWTLGYDKFQIILCLYIKNMFIKLPDEVSQSFKYLLTLEVKVSPHYLKDNISNGKYITLEILNYYFSR